MNNKILSILAVMLAGCSTYSAPEYGQLQADIFRNPTAEYRSLLFYSLNDSLKSDIIDRQMKEFREGGCGGVFFHARIGLLTPYLGQEWWDAMDAGVAAAEREGLQAWFYDEDKWPSGFAGGKIPQADKEFTSQCIVRIDRDAELKPGARILAQDSLYKYVTDKAAWGEWRFNGTAYVDLLNRNMVRAFIDTTYRPYIQRYREKFGKAAFGMFTDEPQIAPRPSVENSGSICYTPEFLATFRKLNGYDMTTVMPLLFGRDEGYEKARIDYYRTVAYLFEQNFVKQIGDFCADNGFSFTGHFMGEESVMSVARYSGNGMTLYRHMQIPGIDHLRLSFSSLTNCKSMNSVANQYGQRRRLCEAYGISGQNMNFEDRKWLLDWLALSGVNLISPHLSAYSLKGERKRDYPPTFSAHQPYWPFNKLFEDYSARLCYTASLGKYAADIAILSPLESAYIEIDPAVKRWNNPRTGFLTDLLERMQTAHRDYDILDEQIASEIARADKNGLHVGEMTYKVVILPDMLTIRPGTIDLLERFAARGGHVLTAGEFPAYVDGVKDSEALARLRKISAPLDERQLAETLGKLCAPGFRIEGPGTEHVWTQRRIVGKGTLLQLSNISRREGARAQLTFAGTPGQVALWDPTTGASYALSPGADGTYRLDFAKTQTWLVTTGGASAQADLSRTYAPAAAEKKCIAVVSGPWKGRRLDPNVLTLDYARYSLDGGKTFSQPEPIIGIHARLRDKGYCGRLLLKFEINAREIPATCSLAVEQPFMYHSVTVNGTRVFFTEEYYCDDSFKTSSIDELVDRGRNEICLSLDYVAPKSNDLDPVKRYGTEIESIYLTGDFGVRARASEHPLKTSQKNSLKVLEPKPVLSYSGFELDAETQTFDGNLTDAGYPFYAGSFELENEFIVDTVENQRRYFLSFPSFEATVIRVEINGSPLPPLVFNPFEADITELLHEGVNSVKVTLTNSLRNMLGPHHHKGGELIAVGPLSFTGETSWTSTDKGEANWYDVRLTGEAGIWRDDYYMVPFGLLEAPQILIQ